MTKLRGVYTIDYHLAPNAKFFLYQVGNSTTKFMSDIGASGKWAGKTVRDCRASVGKPK